MSEIESRNLRKTEIIISYVLRFGVIISAAVIAFGLILTWTVPEVLQGFATRSLPEILSGKLTGSFGVPLNFADFWSRFLTLDPTAVISLGLILLILLPIVRVAMTVILFLLEKDYVYLLITSFVLAVLLFGLIYGKAL